MKNNKKNIQTSFVMEKKLWLKFKSKTLAEGVSVKDKLHNLISDYIKEKKSNASNWFSISKWR